MTLMRSRASKGSKLTHGELDANFVRDVDIKTSNYSALVGDNRTTLECNHASTPFTVTLGDAATMAAAEDGEYEVTILNIGVALITIARAGSDTINGASTSIVLAKSMSVTLKVNAAEDGYNSIANNKGNFRGCLAANIDAQTISATTDTVIAWDAETYDTDTIHDTSTNNSRLTVPTGVSYVRISGQVDWFYTAAGTRAIQIIKNGSSSYPGIARSSMLPDNAGDFQRVNSPILAVSATNYFELSVYQTSGGNLDIASSGYNNWFAMDIIE